MAGSNTGDSFVWIGPVSGVWTTAGNWRDSTTGDNPALSAPGSLDSATFNSPSNLFQVISGSGVAAAVTLTGQNQVVGTIAAGALTVGTATSGLLQIGAGGSVSAGSVAFGPTGSVQTGSIAVAGGTLAVTGSVADGPVMSDSGGTITVAGTLGTGVNASRSARVQAAAVTLINGGGFSWDATSSIEIGTAGGAAAGALTVDDGATLDFDVTSTLPSRGAYIGIGQTLVDNGIIRIDGIYTAYLSTGTAIGSGTIVVADGASLSAFGTTAGSLTFQLGKGALLGTGKIGAGDSIALSGGDVINLGTQTTYDMQAAIGGFDGSDAITIDKPLTAASYNAGALSLSNNGTTIAVLNLSGDYTGATFLVVQTGSSTSEVVLAAPAGAGPSAGAGGGSYVWQGGFAGDWNTAANWADGGAAAAVAPGVSDQVQFNSTTNAFQLITGTGNSANLTLIGNNDVLGTLTTGTLTVGPAYSSGLPVNYGATLRIGAGGSVRANSVAFGYATTMTIAGGTLSVAGSVTSGRFTLDHGTLNVGGTLNALTAAISLNHGSRIQAGSGTLGYYMDAASSVEFGTLGGAALGTVTVDAGATATAGRYMVGSGNVIDNGTITAAGTNDGAVLNDLFGSGTISGTGTIVLPDGASTSTVNAVVAPASLGFSIGTKAVLWLSRVGAGNAIAFNGTGGVLNLFETAQRSGTYDMQAAISGFDATDAITISHVVTSASYAAGVLSLSNNGTAVASLQLAGDYTGRAFLAVPTAANASQIVLAAPAAPGPSAGTANGEAYLWRGPVSGDWNTSGNWTDTTTATTPAAIAPGAKDAVTINGPSTLFQVISGTGNAASLTLRGGQADIVGALTVGTLATALPIINGVPQGIAGAWRIGAGGSVAAGSVGNDLGSVTIAGGTLAVGGSFTQGYYTVPVDNGVFTVAGTLTGSAGATNHSRVQIAQVAAHDYGFATDSTSSIEIGTAGTATAGALTVDAGATYAYARTPSGVFGSGDYLLVGPSLVDNGTITVAGLYPATLIGNVGTIVPTVSGTGTIAIQAGASLIATSGSIAAGSIAFRLAANASLTLDKAAAGNSIAFTAAAGALNLNTPSVFDSKTFKFVQNFGMNATIAGFDTTDAITINSAVTNAAFSGGTLTLSKGLNTVATLNLSGDYTGQTFLIIPVSGTISQVSLFPGTVFVAGSTITVGALAGGTASLDTLLADTNIVSNRTIPTLVINGPGTVSISSMATIDNLDVAGGGSFIMNGALVTTDPVTVDAAGNISGSGTLTGAITDTGTITAAGGSLVLTDAISGSGTLAIAAGATLQLNGAVAGSVALVSPGGNEPRVLAPTASVAGEITGFGAGDTVLLLNGAGAAASLDESGGITTLTLTKAGATLDTLHFSGSFTTSPLLDFNSATGGVTFDAGGITACYGPGTRIATALGETPIELLRVGDAVRMYDGSLVPIQWLGHRRTDCARHPRPHDVQPVRVRAHAFAPGQPARDLLLSPDHAVFVAGVLVPIRYLLNGASIVQETVAEIAYWHVELPLHAVILAEGLPAESYLDTGNRHAFQNGGAATQAHPDFARAVWARHACARLVTAGPELAHIRASLLERLPVGASTLDPDLRASADGIELEPQIDGDWLCFVLPDSSGDLRLRSRVARPAELHAASNDWRGVGVAASEMRIDGEAIGLDDACLGAGWLQGDAALRWTNGDATLHAPPGSIVELRMPRFLRYHARAA